MDAPARSAVQRSPWVGFSAVSVGTPSSTVTCEPDLSPEPCPSPRPLPASRGEGDEGAAPPTATATSTAPRPRLITQLT
jgi:hypothetical protein